MNWIDYILVVYEREIAIILSVLLLVINLANLYFIIDFMSYDEIGYLSHEKIHCFNLSDFLSIFLVTIVLNLLFVFVALFARITKDR